MRFPPHLLDEIRARLPVSDVVGRRVKLKRQGREFAGLSPFNPEKTPSFFVNDAKGFYHCFSSGRHGDIFRFLMETEGLTFPEAVERLAAEAGVPLPRRDEKAEREEKKRVDLADLVERACRFFEAEFRKPGGAAARAYAERRRLDRATLAEFRIGYAPAERDALKRHLLAQGADEAAQIEAGLLIKPDDGRPTYDRFRNRLIIPIQDARGRVVAFGGRALRSEDQPKYLNSPETPLFHKGAMLFNFHRARASVHETGRAIVVEGYLDAIAVWQAGVRAVVATLGTSFTEDQIAALWRLAPEPVVCFDGDKAGVSAAHRAVDRILPMLKSGQSFQFAFLPENRDPDEIVALGGREAFLGEIARAVPLAEVLWDREVAAAPIDTPERKARLEKRLEDIVSEIRDPRVARSYRLRIRLRLSNLFWRSERASKDRQGSWAMPPMEAGRHLSIERILLGLLCAFPELGDKFHDGLINAVRFTAPAHAAFAAEIGRLLGERDADEVASFYDKLDPAFGFVFDDVFGTENTDPKRPPRAAGHRLRARAPVLIGSPPQEFVERYFVHHVDLLLLDQAEAELAEDFSRAGDDVSEDEVERLLEMKRELAARREEYARRDSELADAARPFRLSPHEGVGRLWRETLDGLRAGATG